MTPARALTLLLAESIEVLVARRVAEKTGAPFPVAHAGPSLVALLIDMAADARVYPDRDSAELWRGHADGVARRIYEPWRARFEALCAAHEAPTVPLAHREAYAAGLAAAGHGPSCSCMRCRSGE